MRKHSGRGIDRLERCRPFRVETLTIVKITQSIVILTAILLAGCSGSGLGGADDAIDTQPIASVPAATQPAPATTGTAKSDKAAASTQTGENAEALPGEQYMSNGVVRSLRELTAEVPDTPYPVIQDAPPQERRLLTEEERARIEAELRELGE